MTRFNYLVRARRSSVPRALPVLAIDNRIRGPLGALVATVALTAILCTVQFARLQAAGRTYAAASAQIAADAPALAAVDALRARLSVLAQLDAAVSAMRRSSLARADELAWIGNHLPQQTWLTSLRYEDGAYWLEGTADHAAAVGAALDALHDPAHDVTPQLLSLRDNAGAAGPRFEYRLRLQAAP